MIQHNGTINIVFFSGVSLYGIVACAEKSADYHYAVQDMPKLCHVSKQYKGILLDTGPCSGGSGFVGFSFEITNENKLA